MVRCLPTTFSAPPLRAGAADAPSPAAQADVEALYTQFKAAFAAGPAQHAQAAQR